MGNAVCERRVFANTGICTHVVLKHSIVSRLMDAVWNSRWNCRVHNSFLHELGGNSFADFCYRNLRLIANYDGSACEDRSLLFGCYFGYVQHPISNIIVTFCHSGLLPFSAYFLPLAIYWFLYLQRITIRGTCVDSAYAIAFLGRTTKISKWRARLHTIVLSGSLEHLRTSPNV